MMTDDVYEKAASKITEAIQDLLRADHPWPTVSAMLRSLADGVDEAARAKFTRTAPIEVARIKRSIKNKTKESRIPPTLPLAEAIEKLFDLGYEPEEIQTLAQGFLTLIMQVEVDEIGTFIEEIKKQEIGLSSDDR